MVNDRVQGPTSSEALSDGAQFCCSVAALLASQLAIKISEKFQQPRVLSLENRVSREGGNLLLSGTVK